MDSLSHLPIPSQYVADIGRHCYLIACLCGDANMEAKLKHFASQNVEDVDLRAEMLRRGWDDESE